MLLQIGQPFDDVSVPLNLLRDRGAILISIFVYDLSRYGNAAARVEQIYEIANDPDEEFAFNVNDFESLSSITSTIVQRIRRGKVYSMLQ